MLDINLFRDSPEVIRKALRDRQMDPGVVNNVLELDDRRRQIIQEVEQLKAERNTVSKEIGRMRDPEERQVKIEAMREVGVQIAELDEALRAVEYDLNQLMIR
jgi:seryl-tRNA synthetase